MILGEFLVKHLGFTWCRSVLLPHLPYQIINKNNHVHICLTSLIAHYWHQRGDMNMDFEQILTDIIAMDASHFVFEHPMTALVNTLWSKDDYIRHFLLSDR